MVVELSVHRRSERDQQEHVDEAGDDVTNRRQNLLIVKALFLDFLQCFSIAWKLPDRKSAKRKNFWCSLPQPEKETI